MLKRPPGRKRGWQKTKYLSALVWGAYMTCVGPLLVRMVLAFALQILVYSYVVMSSISITISAVGLASCLLLFSALRLAGDSGSLPTVTLNSHMYNIQLFCIVCKYLLRTFRPFVGLLYAPQKPRRQYSALSRSLNSVSFQYNTHAIRTTYADLNFVGCS